VAAGDGGLNTDGQEERFVLRLLGSGVCNRPPFFATNTALVRFKRIEAGTAEALLRDTDTLVSWLWPTVSFLSILAKMSGDPYNPHLGEMALLTSSKLSWPLRPT
jgi:hypothetical protein